MASSVARDHRPARSLSVVLSCVVALVAAPSAPAAGPTLSLGTAEDSVRQPDLVLTKAHMDLIRLAGFDSVRVTSIWSPGQRQPSETELATLQNVDAAARLDGLRVVLSVYHAGSRTTPLDDGARADFAAYAASLASALPGVRWFIVGNEPNLNRFWMPQFNPDGSDAAAPAYEELLAKTYDALKAVSSDITVIGGAVSPRGVDVFGTGRDTHSPTTFIPDLGAAYRASGRVDPIMDAFAFHPYQDSSSMPPSKPHRYGTTVAIADYQKLVRLLARAFDGTAQPGSTLPIVYDEFGVETRVPVRKAGFYTGAELKATKPVNAATQAAYYRQAVGLAFCQPNVTAIFLFHVEDEPTLATWQSGLFYADGTPKASLGPVSQALADSRHGVVAACRDLQLPVKPTFSFPFAALTPRRLGFRLRCDLECVYAATIERVRGNRAVLTTTGWEAGGDWTRVSFPWLALPGRYRFKVELVTPLNPGPPTVRRSASFVLR